MSARTRTPPVVLTRGLARVHGVVITTALVATVLSAALSDQSSEIREESIVVCVQSYSRPVEVAAGMELAAICGGGGGTTSSSTTSSTSGSGGGGTTTTSTTTSTTTTTTTPPTTTTTTTTSAPASSSTTSTTASTATTAPGAGGGSSGGGSSGGGSSNSGGGSGSSETGNVGSGDTSGAGGTAAEGTPGSSAKATPGSGGTPDAGNTEGSERSRSLDGSRVARGRNASVALLPGVPALPTDSLRTGLVAWSLAHGLAALAMLLRRIRMFLFLPWLRRRDSEREEPEPQEGAPKACEPVADGLARPFGSR